MSNKDNHIIVAIHITDRIAEVSKVQSVLTTFGGIIKTRLGLHSLENGSAGIIILELLDNEGKVSELKTALTAIDGVEVKDIVFSH